MVYHILANGTMTHDIRGRIVKIQEAEPLYNLMRTIKVKKEVKDAQNRRHSTY